MESEEGTLAVNFWWESPVSRAIGSCADRWVGLPRAAVCIEEGGEGLPVQRGQKAERAM